MAQLSARIAQWAAFMAQSGYEVRSTKNGHPYALMQRTGKKVPRMRRKQSRLTVSPLKGRR